MNLTKKHLYIPLILIVGLVFIFSITGKALVDEVFSLAGRQAETMLSEIEKETGSAPATGTPLPVYPRTMEEGQLRLVPSKDWTSGFFPGILWFLYEHTGEDRWKEAAGEFTAKMEQEKWNDSTHDMGFKINCSFGNGYRLTHNEQYKEVIIRSAETLKTRFNPVTGCLRSWDHNRDKWQYPVIIDNLMNLELLFLATRLTGDSSFYHVAVSHALTTMKNHYRPDYSAYHVVDYDPVTGDVMKKNTHQGYADESAWSRGQAWGLYGYTMCYRETGDPVFLQQAENIARFILDHPRLPEDLIPYWDFDAPGIPDEPRDASAASIMASAFYELSTYSEKRVRYIKTADEILENLTADYTSASGENKGFILEHSTGSKPADSEVDVPLIYADYYYLEAFLRKGALKENRNQ